MTVLPPLSSRTTAAVLFALCALTLAGCKKPPPTCPAGQTSCGGMCADLQTNENACGACGNVCGTDQVCQCGACADIVLHADLLAACYWTGELVPVDSAGNLKGTEVRIGSYPASLARYGSGALVLDGHDARLYETRLPVLQQLAETSAVGQFPTQVKADDTYAYVTGSGSDVLDVFGPVSSQSDAGFGLGVVGSVSFGTSSNPTYMAQSGSDLFVSLYGGFGNADGGQRVVKVSVADPANPTVVAQYDLKTLDLKPFPGESTLPDPAGLTFRDGGLYVALNNLDATTFAAGGPGMLAHIDVGTGNMSGIDLGADRCLNPGAVTTIGDQVAVVCAGAVEYNSNYTAINSSKGSGLVLVDSTDAVVSSWSADCVADAGTNCTPSLLGPVAAVGNHLYVGDTFSGRMFQVDVVGGQLQEVHGWNTAAAFDGGIAGLTCAATVGPLQVCPSDALNRANVSDLLPLP